MNYIVLDLEWNQSPFENGTKDEELPFEIVQIGAVKLDEKLNIVSSFDRCVKPQVHKEFSKHVLDIISVDINRINASEYFPPVFEKFINWCGEDVIFCTWGPTDLTELQRNIAYHNINYEFKRPLIYYDIQKFYSILKEDGKQRRTLEYVVNELNIKLVKEFHNAINDAYYTAMICRNIDFNKAKERYSIDCYRIPEKRSEEIHAVYDTYEKFISKGFVTRESLIRDRYIMTGKCYLCSKVMKKQVRWFSNSNRVYYYLGKCQEHGFIKGRLRVKKDDNGKYYAIRILKRTDAAGAEKIVKKYQDTKNKN